MSGRLRRNLPIHLAAALTLAAVAQPTEVAVLTAFHFSWFPRPPLARVGRSIVSTLDYGSILYWVVALAGHFLEYRRRYHLERVQKSELQAQLAEARLQALKTQMHPHFLFNALNSISELIHENLDAADHLVMRLSELLRAFLNSAESQEIELRQEVDFLQRYLEIQQIRFEERLRFDLKLDPFTLNASVPSMILQPLVENAIPHGICNREAEGRIEIASWREGGQLRLRVTDNGDGTPPPPGLKFRDGTGLRNTRRRLENLYGRKQKFSLESIPEGGVQASISIPFTPAAVELEHAPDEYAYR